MAKILTIEDSGFERKIIIDVLNKAGYKEIIEAESAEEGLELYKKEKPDLVLLDIRLPGMDGVECLKKLKEINPKVKVVIVSIITRQESIEECKKLGVVSYIMKPITSRKLLGPVKKALG